ncbi:hypothetical protein WJX73_010359 [Symbiochloris irregularis]|uniref:MYND-type domain-containing protein n=1 Tax=Symbiochloris irregularis TaxID=706552 RepID=A0AAW1PF10_9CHLO
MAPKGRRNGTASLQEWPDMTSVQLYQALMSMGLDASEVQRLGHEPLKKLFLRAVAKMQGLKSPTCASADMNPGTMQGFMNPPAGYITRFDVKLSPAERARLQAGQAEKDLFMRYREIISELAHMRDAGRSPIAILQDKDNTIVLQLFIRGLRMQSTDVPLIEFEYINVTQQSMMPNWDIYQEQVASATGNFGMSPPLRMTVTLLEAMFFKEVLEANAARLHEGYLKVCHQMWGSENAGEFKPSFLVPASPLDERQLDNLQARCANSACGLPADALCQNCREVKYCGRACQKADWKQHKPQCVRRPARTAAAESVRFTRQDDGQVKCEQVIKRPDGSAKTSIMEMPNYPISQELMEQIQGLARNMARDKAERAG